MKKLILIMALSICVLAACTKNKNVITGKITYKDKTGFAYNAKDAVVSVMSTQDKAGYSYSYQTKTTYDGLYTINQVDDGEWYIIATFTQDTTKYIGKTDLFKVKGDDVTTREMLLQ